MKVIVREGAYDDLDRIYAWIAKDEPRSADAVVERILQSAEQLGLFPQIGHVGKAAGTYERVVAGLPYIIVYIVNTDADVLDVVAVFHGARDRG